MYNLSVILWAVICRLGVQTLVGLCAIRHVWLLDTSGKLCPPGPLRWPRVSFDRITRSRIKALMCIVCAQ